MTVKLRVADNGPVRVEIENETDIVMFDGKGEEYKLNGRKTFSICRCGATKNAPFCDGAHKTCQFESAVTACVLPEKK